MRLPCPYSLNPRYAHPVFTVGPMQTMPTQNAVALHTAALPDSGDDINVALRNFIKV